MLFFFLKDRCCARNVSFYAGRDCLMFFEILMDVVVNKKTFINHINEVETTVISDDDSIVLHMHFIEDLRKSQLKTVTN